MEEHYKQYGVVTSFIHILIILVTIFNLSNGTELRPSDHGLAYQESTAPTKDDVSQMLSFFNTEHKTAPLPVAKNLTDSAWWKSDGTDGRSRDYSKGDHVRMILLLASLVIALTGILLLLTSALVFLLRYRKRKMEERSASTSLSNGVVKVDVL